MWYGLLGSAGKPSSQPALSNRTIMQEACVILHLLGKKTEKKLMKSILIIYFI